MALLVVGRLGRLDRPTVSVPECAAAVGATFDASLLAAVLDNSLHEIQQSLAVGEAHHLVVLDPSTEARFAHDLLRQAVYEAIPADRRVHLHTCFAEHFRDQPSHIGTSARHWERAGRLLEAAQALLEQARREQSMQLRSAALRTATIGAELAERQVAAPALLAELHELRCELLLELGDRATAREVLNRCRGLVVRGTLAYVRLERLSARAASGDGQWETASQHLRHCLSELAYVGGPGTSVEFDTEWCAVQIELAWNRYRLPHGDPRSDAELNGDLDEVSARATAQQRVELAHVCASIENMRARFTSPERALQLSHRSLLAARELEDPILIAEKTFSVGFHMLWRRRLDEAETRMTSAAALATDIRADNQLMVPLVYLAVVSRFRGDVGTTRRRAAAGLNLCEREQNAIYVAASRANLAWCALRDGSLATARAESAAAVDSWADPRRVYFPFQGLGLWPALALASTDSAPTRSDLVSRLTATTQQQLPDDIEHALLSGDLDRALQWAVANNLA